MAAWHGWRLGSVQMSIAPHPQNERAIGIIMSDSNGHRVVAEFYSDLDAVEVMSFLDKSFESAALANAQMAEVISG